MIGQSKLAMALASAAALALTAGCDYNNGYTHLNNRTTPDTPPSPPKAKRFVDLAHEKTVEEAQEASEEPASSKIIHCHGINSCKGQSACATATSACAGQNACKGQGFVPMTQAACDDAGGKVN